MNKKIIYILLIITAIIFLAVSFFAYFNYYEKPIKEERRLNPDEILQIAKADKDYAEVSNFVKDFSPEIVAYEKLGIAEYKKIKTEWEKQGLGDRIKLVDKLNLTENTYWIELKNKNDKDKGLRLVLDTKEKKSLLLIVSLAVNAGVGI